jgi:hypothetical protein
MIGYPEWGCMSRTVRRKRLRSNNSFSVGGDHRIRARRENGFGEDFRKAHVQPSQAIHDRTSGREPEFF